MTLPITVRKDYGEPPTRPLSELEIAQAEIVGLRARIKRLEATLRAVRNSGCCGTITETR